MFGGREGGGWKDERGEGDGRLKGRESMSEGVEGVEGIGGIGGVCIVVSWKWR